MKMITRALALLSLVCGFALSAVAEIYAVHSDHLGTPVKMTDSDKRVVWSAVNRGFGEGVYNADPDGDGRKVDMPLRYPGQYFDKESGLHYNYFRYYDPTVGRYITSDPIGLAGGINTYAYAGGDAANYIDPLGLQTGYGGAYPNPAMYDLLGIDGATAYVADFNEAGARGGLAGFAALGGIACYGNPACLGLFGLGSAHAERADLDTGLMCSARGTRNPKVAEAAAKGRQMHKDYDYGPGFEKEVTLPSGKRPDAINRQTREVVELKPDNPNAIRRGERQVEGYRRELESITGECWTCRVEVYR